MSDTFAELGRLVDAANAEVEEASRYLRVTAIDEGGFAGKPLDIYLSVNLHSGNDHQGGLYLRRVMNEIVSTHLDVGQLADAAMDVLRKRAADRQREFVEAINEARSRVGLGALVENTGGTPILREPPPLDDPASSSADTLQPGLAVEREEPPPPPPLAQDGEPETVEEPAAPRGSPLRRGPAKRAGAQS